MACDSCNENQITSITSFPNQCSGCTGSDSPCPSGIVDSTCVLYTGAALSCIGTPSNICLETILQSIDSIICSNVIADYSTYDLGCLRTNYTITNAQQFAEAISQSFCFLNDSYNSFINGNYLTDLQNLQIQINTLNNPGIDSCFSVGIAPSDNLPVVLNKLSSSVCTLYDQINPSSANWNSCFTIVGALPATITEGFNALIGQICQLKSQMGTSGGILPTFDNTGSCLPSPTTTDSLVDTITKIRSRLCQTQTFLASNLPSSDCVTFSPTDSLETVVGAINTQINSVSKQAIRAVNTAHFVLANIDNSNPCLGKTISLNPTYIGSDKLVALNSSDTAGYLSDKITAGSNITFDTVTTPGKIIINGTALPLDGKVKINVSDTSGYLVDKLTGDTSTVSIEVNVAGSQLQISASLDVPSLLGQLLDIIETDDTFKARFCAIMGSCPSPCAPPTNVSYTIV